ncbi:MAG: MBL fold metallo-hydrolase [Gammaproteobacteria bacterium]|nr:MBL fold metallo-hydrolase [Gammaproteobacteria bacterium]
MKITFLGAAGTVTGSKYLLTVGDKKILIDCGLYQGHKELRQRNWEKLPVDPGNIDAVILTHAHIDHSGYLPLLVKNGFKGPIYATPGTKELCEIMLPDSGHIQEEDAFLANKYGFSKHNPALPLYTIEDALKVIPQFVSIPFEKTFQLLDDFSFTLLPAAHILGAAFIRIHHNKKTIVFTGDMGRTHDPIMRAPAIISEADYLIIESTYGDREHVESDPGEQLAKIINKTAKRGGTIIIPSFAVGRAQSILYYLAKLKEKDLIPDLPIFVDSPMATSVTDIYERYIAQHRLGSDECKKIFDIANYVNSVDESKAIDNYTMPIIIISASGMATGGRVLHHLKALASESRNTIIFTGYQPDGTRGAKIVNGDSEVRIHGQMVPINAQVEVMQNMSAHADSKEIMLWLSHFKNSPQRIFIIHGEPKSSAALKEKIEKQFHWNCVIPHYMQTENIE